MTDSRSVCMMVRGWSTHGQAETFHQGCRGRQDLSSLTVNIRNQIDDYAGMLLQTSDVIFDVRQQQQKVAVVFRPADQRRGRGIGLAGGQNSSRIEKSAGVLLAGTRSSGFSTTVRCKCRCRRVPPQMFDTGQPVMRIGVVGIQPHDVSENSPQLPVAADGRNKPCRTLCARPDGQDTPPPATEGSPWRHRSLCSTSARAQLNPRAPNAWGPRTARCDSSRRRRQALPASTTHCRAGGGDSRDRARAANRVDRPRVCSARPGGPNASRSIGFILLPSMEFRDRFLCHLSRIQLAEARTLGTSSSRSSKSFGKKGTTSQQEAVQAAPTTSSTRKPTSCPHQRLPCS